MLILLRLNISFIKLKLAYALISVFCCLNVQARFDAKHFSKFKEFNPALLDIVGQLNLPSTSISNFDLTTVNASSTSNQDDRFYEQEKELIDQELIKLKKLKTQKKKKIEKSVKDFFAETIDEVIDINGLTNIDSKDIINKKEDFVSVKYSGTQKKTENLKQQFPLFSSSESDKKKSEMISLERLIGTGTIADVEDEEVDSVVSVSPFILNLINNNRTSLTNFELIPSYNKSIRWSDEGTGQIVLSEKLNSNKAVTNALIMSHLTIPTRTDINMFFGNSKIDIPVILREDFETFLEREKFFKNPEGILLVNLNGFNGAVDIDHDYEERFLLDSHFKKVADFTDANYILYIGIRPGNVLISYTTKNSEILDKIVGVYIDEMTYESLEFHDREEQVITLEEVGPLGKENARFDIEANKMTLFNKRVKFEKTGLGEYKFIRSTLPLGMRRYIDLKDHYAKFLVGSWDDLKMTIPHEEYIQYVLKMYDLESISEHCVVQFNFKKQVLSFTYDSEDSIGPMPMDLFYLDNEGQTSDEMSPIVNSAFAFGQGVGKMSVKVKYADHSSDLFNTYCAPGNYILEQL